MVDISAVKYNLIAVLGDGRQLDLTGAAQDLGWEEGEGELALRTSFTVHNVQHEGKYLSDLLKPGSLVAVIADWGESRGEVARGFIVDWDISDSSTADTFAVLAYDELFNLQHIIDSYITAGTGTKAAILSVFTDWGIPLGEYKGPDVAHGKTLFKNEYLGDILTQLLGAAEKQGAEKCLVRASKGAASVVPVGGNATIYCFSEDTNMTVTKDKISTQSLVTRVKVVGKEDKQERQPVEAIVDGRTEFGIRQRIYNRGEDDSLATAKAEAQKIIDTDGMPTRTTSIEAPDVPPIRKGDKVHVTGRRLNGYYIVKSVQHNAAAGTMTLGIDTVAP